MPKALLIVDVQNDYFPGGKAELYEPLSALENIEYILETFRNESLAIIHVQHINIREGATFFLPDTDGVSIHKKLTPLENEHLVVKHSPNSFFETNLSEILKRSAIDELVVCGMMSHMCIDTTVRACKDHGIKVTLLEDACATKSIVFRGQTIDAETVHRTFMASLNGMFAEVVRTKEIKI